jgi:NAD(P)-dependent dehydrogenase (short-subunit alcohol dehydrogenase family)
MGQLTGKVALVTGAGAGIGFAAARRFVDEGAYVFVTGRHGPALDSAVAKIGPAATGVVGDVSNPADLDHLYAVIRDHGRGLDVLFANVGIGEPARLGEITEEQIDRIFGTNVRGLVLTVQKALPLLNDGASIILPSSVVASTGPEGLSLYSATKAAARSFARTWANELSHRGIRVNALAPGVTDTPGLKELAADTGSVRKLLAAVPLGRMARAEEQAAAALFLAGDQSSYVTGIELVVDGGVNQV